jgi:hypothetical protein
MLARRVSAASRSIPFRLCHQGGRSNQQIPKAGAGRDAGMPVVRRVAIGESRRVPPFAGQKEAFPGHEHIVEQRDGSRLTVPATETGGRLARSPRRPRDQGQPGSVHAHGTTHSVVLIWSGHVAARHHQQFVHVWGAGDDGLGAAKHDSVLAASADVHVGIGVGLRVRAPRPIAFPIRHGDANRQVLVAGALDVGGGAGAVIGVQRCIHLAGGRHHCRERVARQIPLSASGFLAQQPYGFELVEQIVR